MGSVALLSREGEVEIAKKIEEAENRILESLLDLKNYYDEIIYISYFTVKPEKNDIDDYVNKFNELLVNSSNTKLWILGQMLNVLDIDKLPKGVSAFKSIKLLTASLK